MDNLKDGSQSGGGQHQRILFAEDDVDVGYFVTEMLRAEGFDVTKVESGDDGATTFDSQSFHLLLTDVRMPGTKDGLDLAEHVLERNPNLPIVIVSGFAEEIGARLAALGRKATFLRKPFLMGELVSAIQSALLSASVSAVIFGLSTVDDLSAATWFGALLEGVT